MFVYARFTYLSRFINENIERKQTTEVFLNEKFIQISLSKRVQFEIRDDKRPRDLKELQVHCSKRDQTHVQTTVFKNFAKNC